jgi:hypothetical protein
VPAAFGGPPPIDQPAAALSDTMDRMLRPQGLFQNSQQVPPGWQQPQAAGPGAFPPGGQYPQGAPYPPGAGYPQGGQYPQADQYPPAGPGAGPGYPADGQYPPGVPAGGGYPGPYPNGQYAGPQYADGQYGQDQYGNGQYGQDQFPPGMFGPGVQYGPDGMPLNGGDGQPGPRSRLPFKWPKGRLVPAAVAGGLVLIVVVALVLSMHGGSATNAGAGPTDTPTASTSATSALTQQQAATALSGLLAQSGTDHSDVNAAVSNVEACGKGLAQDAQVFTTAAGNRRTLLTKLAQLPGRPALPPAMISDLTAAWQASATVDADLAKWATDAAGHCRKGNLKDPNYTATIPFDSKATNGKIAFVRLWNPLAKKDGLPSYQSSEL